MVRRVGELLTALHAAEGLVLDAARKIDASGSALDATRVAEVAVSVSEAKAFAEDVVMAITNEMFALLGSGTTHEELNLNRHWRNAAYPHGARCQPVAVSPRGELPPQWRGAGTAGAAAGKWAGRLTQPGATMDRIAARPKTVLAALGPKMLSFPLRSSR